MQLFFNKSSEDAVQKAAPTDSAGRVRGARDIHHPLVERVNLIEVKVYSTKNILVRLSTVSQAKKFGQGLPSTCITNNKRVTFAKTKLLHRCQGINTSSFWLCNHLKSGAVSHASLHCAVVYDTSSSRRLHDWHCYDVFPRKRIGLGSECSFEEAVRCLSQAGKIVFHKLLAFFAFH
jgi:hypothetical protein